MPGRSRLREVSYSEYLEFLSRRKVVAVGNQEVELVPIKVKRFTPLPEELTDVSTTIWSFPRRGSWATHKGDYRGNWPPQMARALIAMYTKPGELVLDPMAGSGTTCIEARLLGRNCIAVDINYDAVILTLHKLYWLEEGAKGLDGLSKAPEVKNIVSTWSRVYEGDARNLSIIESGSIDLIATHPPYWNIIDYGSKRCVEGDLSCASSLEEYLKLIGEVAKECYRVLRPGGHLGILVGDTRMHKHYVPLTYYVLDVFLKGGFMLREEVIKVQHKMKSTREVWSKLRKRDFLLIYHEKLFVFRKPIDSADRERYKYSCR